MRAKIDKIHNSKKNDENDQVIDIVPMQICDEANIVFVFYFAV